jgi:hypothetical protein
MYKKIKKQGHYGIKQSCHASGVTPAGRCHRPKGFRMETDMKTGAEDSKANFRTKSKGKGE